MEALQRIARLILRPAAEWDRIAGEPTSVADLLCRYILPLALLAPIATMIGMTVFDRNWDPVHGYLVPSDRILVTGAATYVAIVGSIFVLSAILFVVAPMFGGARDYPAALKVATYGSTPVLLAGATLVLPIMALVALVALGHALHLMWIGARRVLNVRASGGTEFIAICIVALMLVSMLVGAVASALLLH